MLGGVMRLRVLLCVTSAVVLLAACQVIGSSTDFVTRPDGKRVMSCESGLGNYSLAYSTIKVTVRQDYIEGTNAKTGAPFLDIGTPQARPDPDHRYCLNFLESAFADDKIEVAWSGTGSAAKAGEPREATSQTVVTANNVGNGLLALVVSKNVDRTGEVIRKLIRAIFLAVSGNADSTFGRAGRSGTERRMMTEQDVDPFDIRAMAKLNSDLRQYGFCITLGKYTHDINSLGVDKYCNNPALSLKPGNKSRVADIVGDQDYLVRKMPTGIYYRPKQPYSLFVYVRDDAGRGSAWQLRKVDTIELENISPIISLNVTRRMFAENKVALAFNNGNLLDYCLIKGSEVEGFVNIPIDIIHGIVSLPAATISAEINRDKAKIGLFQAQEKVIAAQNAYIDFILEEKELGKDAVDGKPLAADVFSFKETSSSDDFVTVSRVENPTIPNFCAQLKTGS